MFDKFLMIILLFAAASHVFLPFMLKFKYKYMAINIILGLGLVVLVFLEKNTITSVLEFLCLLIPLVLYRVKKEKLFRDR